jgi:hypothetical protein
MESFLNTLWLVIALAALCVWRVRWAQQPRERRYADWHQWTAFACALVLLFFMVSLTDDLHSELVVFEECSAGRRHATCASCPHHAPPSHPSGDFQAICRPPIFDSVFAVLGSVSPDRPDFQPVALRRRDSGRAPPVISL